MSDLFDPKSLLGPCVRRYAVVPIEDLGNVRIQSFTEGQRARLEASMKDKKGQLSASRSADFKCRLIVEAVVDGNNANVYTNADVDRIRQQDAKITNDLVDAILSHTGFSDEDIEDLTKNSEATATAS